MDKLYTCKYNLHSNRAVVLWFLVVVTDHSPLNSVCAHTNIWAVVEKGKRLMKTTGRPEWVLPPVCQCHNTPLPLWCDACMSIRGPLLNCAADSRRLSCTRVNALYNLLKDHFKRASLREVTWAACVSSVLVTVWTSTLRLWCHLVEARSSGVRVSPRWAWHQPGSWSGLEATAAVRCCKWQSELTDHPQSLLPQWSWTN